jgi:hypothetical protein
MKKPILTLRGRPRAGRGLLPALIVAVVAIVFGGIPGSALRSVVFEKWSPPVPTETRDRDARIVAHVRSDAGGPIAAARVQVFTLVAGDVGPRAYLAGLALTGADGSASVRDLPRGETWVLADAVGHARASSAMVLEEGERAIELILGAEHRLDVDVKDERGDAVPTAEIEAIAAGDPLPVGARAGEGGLAHVLRLGSSPWIVTVRANGYEEVTYRGVREGEPLHATLRRLGAITAKVLGDGDAPAAGARVLIASASLWPARMADTGPDGTVRIGGLAAGSYALRAVRGDMASPIELGVALARGEEKSVTLRLGPGERVAVRVTEGEGDDADPIAGARVTLAEAGLSPFPVEATTDKDGRAHLGPIARGDASLAVRAEGFVARGAIPVASPPPPEVRVPLVRAGTLDGRVVDVRGFPVDGATIEIVGTDFYGAPIDDDPRRARFREAHFTAALSGPRPLLPAGELGVMPGPVPPIPHGESAAPIFPAAGPGAIAADEPWITRDDGTFHAAPVSPGRVRALVRHPQYVEAISDAVTLAPGGTARVTVVMHTGGILEGRVVDERGGVVGGANVVVAAARGSMERSSRTASDGTFAFAALPDAVTVMVSPEDDLGQVQARVAVTIPEGGKKTITVTLPAARPPLPVRVTDDRGYATSGAQVSVVSLDPASTLRTTAFTDDRGEGQLAGAKGLALRAFVSAPGHAPRTVLTEAGAESLRITLAPAESAKGEITSTRGAPLVDAEVVLYTDSETRHTRTDPGGGFAFAEHAAGAARLRIRAAGFAPVARDVVIAAAGGHRATDLGRIELAAGGSVEGRVVDGRGDPVPGARVALDRVPTYLTVGTSPAGVGVADAKGVFRLADLPEGTITLEAFAPDVGRTRVADVRVVADRTTRDVRITLRPSTDEAPLDNAAPGGVAVTLGETDEPREVVVVSVAEASEGERAGLAPGDVLVEIDGASVHTIAEARPKLSGPLGDDVLLKIRRGDRALVVRVPREPVRR